MFVPDFNAPTEQPKTLAQKSSLKSGYRGPFDLDDTFKRDDVDDSDSNIQSSLNDRQESLDEMDF